MTTIKRVDHLDTGDNKVTHTLCGLKRLNLALGHGVSMLFDATSYDAFAGSDYACADCLRLAPTYTFKAGRKN